MLDIILAICVIALVIGSISDLKTYEVPDWLNFSLIALGLGINLIFSLAHSDASYFINSVIGLVFSIGVGYLMFYTGQWGGGDSKMLMGLGAMIGLAPRLSPIPTLLIFYANIGLVGAFYGLVWIMFYFIANARRVISKCAELLSEKRTRMIRYILSGLIIAALIALSVVPEHIVARELKLIFSLLLVFLYLMLYMWALVKSIEQVCMIRKIDPDKLTEGDWIVDEINIDGEYVCGPKDLGIDKDQIKKLIALKRKKMIDKVTIKQGIPFVPSFFFAFVYTIIFGNIIVLSWIILV